MTQGSGIPSGRASRGYFNPEALQEAVYSLSQVKETLLDKVHCLRAKLMEGPGAVETHQDGLVRYFGKAITELDTSAIVVAAAQVLKQTRNKWLEGHQRIFVTTEHDIWMRLAR